MVGHFFKVLLQNKVYIHQQSFSPSDSDPSPATNLPAHLYIASCMPWLAVHCVLLHYEVFPAFNSQVIQSPTPAPMKPPLVFLCHCHPFDFLVSQAYCSTSPMAHIVPHSMMMLLTCVPPLLGYQSTMRCQGLAHSSTCSLCTQHCD